MESDNYRVHVVSSNYNNECVEIQGSNEYNESIEKDYLSFECEEVDSNANESSNCNHQEEDGYESGNKLWYSEYEVEELYDSSGGNYFHDKNECCNDSNVPDCYTNDFVVMNSSFHLNNNHSQENICEAVFLSPDEISSLLARDFEKHVSVSKDLHIFPHNISSFNQVTSPKFDVEREVKSEQSLLDCGGVYDNTSNVFVHEDLLDVEDVSEGKFNVVTYSSHAYFSVICFDASCDEEENSKSCQSQYGFSLCANNSCRDKFKVHSDILLNEENDCDQHSVDQHFQNKFSCLVTNQLFRCEEVLVKNKYDSMNDMTASRQQSDFAYSSIPDTQGELQNFDTFNFLNKVEYESFMFLVDSMHHSNVDDNFQNDSNLHEHADLFSHSDHDVEVNTDVCMHYENGESYFIFLSDLFQDANLIDETDRRDAFNLPPESADENQIYDRGKKLC